MNLSNCTTHAHATHDMVWVEGGEFRMGSDTHYPEEAPAHRVQVDGFFIDPYPVTNRQFATFVAATGYRTVAERPPNPPDYPGALPHMLKPGSLVLHMARPEEVASVIGFVAGDGASYLTATTISADGGIMQSSVGL
jgi:sulfatase modifying factor 1